MSEAADAIVLHPDDHVATALRRIEAGETVRLGGAGGGETLVARQAIPLCHKVALADIPAGTHLRKYGEVIGEAIAPIGRGDPVHVHNLRSLRARG